MIANTLINHKHTLSHCSMFHLEPMTCVIRLQTQRFGQKPLVFCETRRVSLPVSRAKIPREDCQEKRSVLFAVRGGFKLLVSTQTCGVQWGLSCACTLQDVLYRFPLQSLLSGRPATRCVLMKPMEEEQVGPCLTQHSFSQSALYFDIVSVLLQDICSSSFPILT